MKQTETKNLFAESSTTKTIESTNAIGTKPTTINTLAKIRQSKELQGSRVEVLQSPEDLLSVGVLESMSIIDSSATALHSQMASLLKTEDPDVRRPGEWATQLAIECGNGIANLIKAKTDAMKLLQRKS